SDAMALTDADARRAALNACRRGESAAGLAGALTLASTEPGVAVEHEALDADPYLLNCVNGVLDLRPRVLEPHEAKVLLTQMAGARYDAGPSRVGVPRVPGGGAAGEGHAGLPGPAARARPHRRGRRACAADLPRRRRQRQVPPGRRRAARAR